MPERRLIWSDPAIQELEEILHFFDERNGSSDYGDKLLAHIERTLERYRQMPELGERDRKSRRRFFICGNYCVFYRFTQTEFEVVKVWDSRRNPDDLKVE